jgi:hypothetical protein
MIAVPNRNISELVVVWQLFRETIASFLEMPAPFSAQLIWQVCGKMHRHPACPGFGVGIHVYVQSPASNIDVWSL